MIIRPDYIKKLGQYIDVPVIKILAGIRRCGKSTILEMLKEQLIKRGISPQNIISKRYSSLENENISAKKMYDDLKSYIKSDERYYFLLDEVQEVDNWEKAINSLSEEKKVDIYVTGSNSRLMSSEISTFLTGRYVTIPVYTLSFKEFIQFKNLDIHNYSTLSKLLNDYIRFGGFPLVSLNNLSQNASYQIVEDIYNSVVVNDIAKRHKINNLDLFERVVKFVIDNVGNTFSANTITKYLKNEGRTIHVETIYNYLEWLEKAFIIYRCKRYDLQGKQVLKTQEKFYLADQSIKYSLLGYNPNSISAILENIVYFELKRNDFDVFIGKNGDREIDFVAQKRDEKVYIQICKEMPRNSDREIENLLEIEDNYPKYIITLDELAVGNIKGVRIVHLLDFLLNGI